MSATGNAWTTAWRMLSPMERTLTADSLLKVSVAEMKRSCRDNHATWLKHEKAAGGILCMQSWYFKGWPVQCPGMCL